MTNTKTHDAATVKAAAAGRWLEILTAAGIPADLLDGKGHPCPWPGCGGTDRFAAQRDFAERGAVICRNCHAMENGDGLSAIRWFLGISFPEAVQWVADYLKLNPPVARTGEAPASTKPTGKAKAGNACGKIVATYDYHDSAGNLAYHVVRFDPKDFRQRRPDGKGGWIWNMRGVTPLPYRLPELLAADPADLVFVVEGEKDADNLAKAGVIAVTNHGGALKWTAAHSKHLAGRNVVIIPDNDEPGERHGQAVAASLHGVASSVRVVRLPTGKDVSDWLEAGGTPERLWELANAAPAWVPPAKPAEDDTAPTVARWKPFPVAALPSPFDAFVREVSKAMGCDPSFVALPLLAALAAAIGSTRRLVVKRGWTEPAILWAAIVGESGTTKTPPFKQVMKPVRELQRQALAVHRDEKQEYETALAHYEKNMGMWRRDKGYGDPPSKPQEPHAVRYVVADTTVEALAPILAENPRGLLLARDELAGWLGSFDRYASGRGGDSAHWLSMHNGIEMLVDRKTSGAKTIYVDQAHVSIVGGIQPAILKRALGVEHWESGLAARLLVTCPPRKPKVWTEADIDPETEATLFRLISRLYALQPAAAEDGRLVPEYVVMSADAKRLWVDFYNTHGQEQADLTGDLSAAWSKLEAYAARLALVLHFARWAAEDASLKPDEVDADSMRRAVTLAKWFKNETLRVYALLGEGDDARAQSQLVEWIQRKGGVVSVRDLQRGPRRYAHGDAAERALHDLVQAGLAKLVPSPASAKGGAPTVRYAPCGVADTTPCFRPPAGDGACIDAGENEVVSVSALQAVPGDNRTSETNGGAA
jgi:hypothetical protein